MEEKLIIMFMPPLLELLETFERKQQSNLTKNEVETIRDKAIGMVVRRSVFEAMVKKRGYRDLRPEYVWEDWMTYKNNLEGSM